MTRTHHHPFRRAAIAAIVLVTACGGTSGLEGLFGSDASSDSGTDDAASTDEPVDATGQIDGTADVTPRVDSAADALPDADSRAGSGRPVDGGSDAFDATLLDRTIPDRPDARDTGIWVPPGPGPGSDASVGPSVPPFPLPEGSSTYSILAAKGPRCLRVIADGSVDTTGTNSCAFVNGCLDPNGISGAAGLCEQFTGPIGGSTEIGDPKQNCLQTLYDIVNSHCAAGDQLTPCICGDADNGACLSGGVTPDGLIYPDYKKSYFPSTKGSDLQNDSHVPTFGASMANIIVDCIAPFAGGTPPNGCDDCLGIPYDAGNDH